MEPILNALNRLWRDCDDEAEAAELARFLDQGQFIESKFRDWKRSLGVFLSRSNSPRFDPWIASLYRRFVDEHLERR